MNHTRVFYLGLALGIAVLAGCREPYQEKGWATKPISRDYTFPARDWETGEVIAEGQTYTAAQLDEGRKEYMHYCYACHGVNGDGKGPAAHGLRPPPRDFRIGKFKFGAVRGGQKPNDWDFLRIIRGGLHGTAMLQWDITDEEVLRIVQFIKTFPQKPCNEGVEPDKVTAECQQEMADNPDGKPSTWEEVYTRDDSKGRYKKGELKQTGEPITLTEDPWQGRVSEAVQKGMELYHLGKECVTCHPAYVTRADYTAMSVKVDGVAKTSFRDNLYTPELKDSDYGVKVMPPDFTLVPLRSIRPDHELEDLYRVIAAGVGGTAMTSWIDGSTQEELWALVHYIKSLKDLYKHENRQKRYELADKLGKQAPAGLAPPPAPPPAEPPPDEPEGADTAAPADSAAPTAAPTAEPAPTAAATAAPTAAPKETPKDKPKDAPKDPGKGKEKAPPKKAKDADPYP
jgi:mono/diheme cytochrome c family protein